MAFTSQIPGYSGAQMPGGQPGMMQQPQQQQQPLPQMPSQQMQDRFIPQVLQQPFLDTINAAGNLGSFGSQAVPQASMFQQNLYSPHLNPMEMNFLGSAAGLGWEGGRKGLDFQNQRIDAQYENTPFASSRGRQMDEAATEFGRNFVGQMANTGSQMGLQRQQMATQNLPFAMEFPLRAGAAGQQAAGGMLNLGQQAMYGDTQYPMQVQGSYPLFPPTYVQPAPQAQQGGGIFSGVGKG